MNKLKTIIIFLVLGIAAFTHFYRIDQTFVFQNDEGRDALITYRMITTGRPVLLGPETSVGNMYLGPFYYYLMVPALWLSNLDPVGPAVMVGIFAIMTTYLLILLGRKFHNSVAGITAGLFYALSPVMVHYSRSSWNPNVIPFFIALMILYFPLKKSWHALLFGILTGIIFQLHYVALVVPALLFISLIYSSYKKKEYMNLAAQCGLILVGFFVSSLPFWIFEVRHSFVNVQAFFTYLSSKTGRDSLGYPPYYLRLFANLKLVVSGMLGSSSVLLSPLGWVGIVSSFALFVLFILVQGGVLSYLLLASILIVSILKESIYIHYLGFLFPVISLAYGIALTHKNFLLKISALILTISLLVPTYKSLDYNLGELTSSQPIRAADTANYINREAAGRPYNVVNSQGSFTTTISYYLAKSENPPKQDLQNLIYDICIGGPCPESDETTVLLFLTGPAHPSIGDYVGHPQQNEFSRARKIIKNEWVTYDVWVATINLQP